MRLVRVSLFLLLGFVTVLAPSVSFGQGVAERINKSLKLIEIGNPKQALSDLQDLQSANPKNADVMGAVAIAMLESGKPFSDVENLLTTAYDLDHKSVYVRTARGQLFGKQGKREDAVKEFRQALKIDPKNIGTYLSFARFYISVDSLKAAEVTLYQAQGVNSNDVRSYLGLAELYEKQRIKELAIQQYEQAKKLDPNDLSVLAKLAGLYYRARKYDESINEWIKITKIDSTYARAYYEIAWIFFRSEQYANAATYAEKYVALAPNDIEGMWLAAQALAESGQYQKALPYLQKAATVDSLKDAVQLYLGRGYFFSKDFAQANAIFGAAKSLGPYDLYYWGYSLIASGDTTGGIAKWKQSLDGDTVRKKEEKVKVYQQIISLYSSQKNWGEAGQTYLDMNSVAFSLDNFVKAGQLFTFGQMYDSAKQTFATVLQKDPKNLGALIGMADVYMQAEATAKDAEASLDQAAALATTKDQQESVGQGYARLGIKYYTFKNFEKCVSMLEAQRAQKYLGQSSPYLINVYKVLAGGYIQLKKYEKAEDNYKKALQINPKDEDIKKGLEFLKQTKGKK